MIKFLHIYLLIFTFSFALGQNENHLPDLETDKIESKKNENDETIKISPLKNSTPIPYTLKKYPSKIYTGKEFDYTENRKKTPQRPEKEIKNNYFLEFLIKFFNKIYTFFTYLSVFLSYTKYLFFILAALFLIFIIYILIKNIERKNKKIKKASENLDYIEKNIETVDLNEYLNRSIREKNYEMAVRFYFLIILKALNEKKIITYKYQKANYEYFKEIQNKKILTHFKELSLIFDYVWYGHFTINKNQFELIQNKFKNLDQLIK